MKRLQYFGFYEAHQMTLSVILIHEELDGDLGYLHLHHKTMQTNYHQYIEFMSMRVGILHITYALKDSE